MKNNDTIDKFFDTINGFVCIKIEGMHSFCAVVPHFSAVYFILSLIWNSNILTRCDLISV